MPVVAATNPRVKLYAQMAELLLAQRYMRQLEQIGAPHAQRKIIDQAINLMAPGYRDQIEHDLKNTELFKQCNVGPNGVESAIRLAYALREVYGIADKPRSTTTI